MGDVGMSEGETPAPLILSPEEKARQARRSRAIAYGICGLAVLFYAITIFRMGPAILQRAL